MECAGFINGLKQGEVVVLVRSIVLRGFDRDCIDRVEKYMADQGLRIVKGVLPESIVKLPTGKLLVSYGGASEEFDTVLVAVGRYADVDGLGLDSIGVEISPRTRKIICRNEQTSVPHIYAIGDVVDGSPELTPVAILAGRLLSKRLFGSRDQVILRYT